MQASCSTPWSRLFTTVVRARARDSFTIPTAGRNICLSNEQKSGRNRHRTLCRRLRHSDQVRPLAAVGDSGDNALTKTMTTHITAKVIHHLGSWCNFEAVGYATLVWADGFNNLRLPVPIWSISASGTEAKFQAALQTGDMAVQLSEISIQHTLRDFIPPLRQNAPSKHIRLACLQCRRPAGLLRPSVPRRVPDDADPGLVGGGGLGSRTYQRRCHPLG